MSGKTYQGKLPFDEIVIFPSQKQQRDMAIKRADNATKPHFDFSKAQDIDKFRKLLYNSPTFNNYIRASNCLNTATYWITGNQTISANKNLLDNPEKYGYKRISKEEAEPGDLTQYLYPSKEPFHAGIVLENDENGTVVKSSDGNTQLNPIRYYNSNGYDMEGMGDIVGNLYYRYTYPYSGVYFKQNGKLIKAKRLGGTLGYKNIIGL